MTTSEEGSILSRRSSSQTSHQSSESKRTKGAKGRPQRSSHQTDPSLTSFPSFSPEQIEDGMKQDTFPKPLRTISQKVRERKATLAGLTSGSPLVSHQNALFDDSPRSSIDIPGALHLAGDDHISRLIARTGAVKLVRQFAQDLAQRDSEMTALRNRADSRERELKRLLRKADVTSAEIEKRLLGLEHNSGPVERNGSPQAGISRNSTTNIDGMMHEAMSAEVGLDGEVVESPPALQESSFAHSSKFGQTPPRSRRESTSAPPPDSIGSSRKTSRASSIVSQDRADIDATLKPRPSSSKSKPGVLENIFQPPTSQSTSYFIGGAPSRTVKKSKAGDAVSVRSNQSSSSFTSWTKIFGGSSQARKDEIGGRPRSSSVEQGPAITAPKPASGSALASLSKVRTNQSTSTGTVKAHPTARRIPTASRLSTSPNHVRKDSNASEFPPTVEMDSMFKSSQLPPTMTTYNHDVEGLLTDRFGFIYDQRQRKRQNAPLMKHKRQETLGSFRIGHDSDREDTGSPGADGKPSRPSTPVSIEEDGSNSKKPWQDYLKVSSTVKGGRPRELLSHTPSASAVVTVSIMDTAGSITPPRPNSTSGTAVPASASGSTRVTSISVGAAQKALPATSVVTVTSADTDDGDQVQEPDAGKNSDKEPVKLLLEQLKELHDNLQVEKTVKWNDFLRRVRAERATAADRSTNNAPEAELLNGELIGVATLGRSGKTKSKYLLFKSLVLTGIPVSLRPKIWAECAGATLRIPGYYDDLVTRSEGGDGIDPDIATQIKADIRRTLTDNIFFRHGPGVQRLEELLRAYSLHNARIGYCQGMNLITASLLLICATPEDCFWLLVAIIDHILPSGYFDANLLVARADQIVLRGYVAEVLPKLDAKLQELGVELEACTFHWFLSLYTGVLTGGEALYRVWDVVLCLHSQQDAPANTLNTGKMLSVDVPGFSQPMTPVTVTAPTPGSETEHDGTSSPFLFQLALALLKLNESAILALDSPALIYGYINHSMTNHGISLDGLINSAEALRMKVQREDVLERRKAAVKELQS